VRRPAKASLAGSSSTIGRAAFGLGCLWLLAFTVLAGKTESAIADTCPNDAIRAQQGVQALPDCRAYEMVSPLDKNSGNVSKSAIGGSRSTPDGEGFEFESTASFADGEIGGFINQYTSRRSATGWTTEALNLYKTPDPRALLFPQGYYSFTPDLTKGVLVTNHDPNDRSGDVSEDGSRLYLRMQGGAYVRLSPPPAKPAAWGPGPVYGGSSDDMSRIFFESYEELLPGAPPFANQVYEWHDGEVEIAGRLPNGEVSPEGAWLGAGTEVIGGAGAAVSGDGSQIVLSMGWPQQIYLRENGQSKPISVSQVEGEEGTPAEHGAMFMGTASEDGRGISTIFFASPDLLTDDAEGNPNGWEPMWNETYELYAYDVRSEELTYLSIKTLGGGSQSAYVAPKWIASSDDASYVYFSTQRKLTPDAESDMGIYLWHEGQVRYLGDPGVFPPNIAAITYNNAQVSADGRRFALVQMAGLNQPPVVPGVPADVQHVYLYDAPSDQWTCASCSSDGPNTKEARFFNVTGGRPGLDGSYYPRRNLLPDGSALYFESDEALVPHDNNGARDVYQWRDGEVSLISTGRDPSGSHFLDAGVEGRDVFIATREALVAEDTDNFIDAYDVRAGGGFLHEALPRDCAGDACQGDPGPPRSWSAPGSSQVAGTVRSATERKTCAQARKPKRGAGNRKGKAARASGKGKVAAKGKQRCGKPRTGKGGGRR
jgi:hypothetical protein